jgi:hypothetical protein
LYRLLDNPLRVISRRAELVLAPGYAEEKDGGDFKFCNISHLGVKLVGGKTKDTGHGGYLLPYIFALNDKQGIDQIADINPSFADERP